MNVCLTCVYKPSLISQTFFPPPHLIYHFCPPPLLPYPITIPVPSSPIFSGWPRPTYQWYRGKKLIPHATKSKYRLKHVLSTAQYRLQHTFTYLCEVWIIFYFCCLLLFPFFASFIRSYLLSFYPSSFSHSLSSSLLLSPSLYQVCWNYL